LVKGVDAEGADKIKKGRKGNQALAKSRNLSMLIGDATVKNADINRLGFSSH
jgi:hypothetical protein